MLQRTLITNNVDQLSAYIEEIKALPEYKCKGDKLLLFSSPDADSGTLRERVAAVRRALPEAKIVGMTTHKNEAENGFALEGEDYSFLLMERARAELLYYDCREISAQEAGKRFDRELRGMKDVAAVLLFTVCASGAFAADYRVEVQGASNPRVTDTVKSYLEGFGCTGLNGTLTVKIVQLLENSSETPTTAADSATNHDADDPKIDYYAEFSAHYENGVRDDATITYTEAVKENGAWKTVSDSTFTMDRQYIVACYVQTDDNVDSEQIFANFGNGATFFKVTNSCVEGSVEVLLSARGLFLPVRFSFMARREAVREPAPWTSS